MGHDTPGALRSVLIPLRVRAPSCHAGNVASPRRPHSPARRTPVAVVLLALLAGVWATGLDAARAGGSEAAERADAARAAATGRVWGAVVGPDGDVPRVEVRIFADDWTYLRSGTSHGGAFSVRLPPGRYHLQFADRRPAYDVGKYAPTDRTVTVTADGSHFVSVRMKRGGFLYGTAYAGGAPAKYATIKATNRYDQTYTTRADGRGRFALGGLPRTRYYVFTYDRTRTWVGPGIGTGRIDPGEGRGITPRLSTRAGRLIVGVQAGGQPVRGTTATAISRRTGQFWTATARRGLISFAGLAPGRYVLRVGGYGDWFGTTARPGVRVRSGKVAVTEVTLTRRGAQVTGRVVDAARPTTPLAEVQVVLFDAQGRRLGVRRTGADGRFVFGGQLTGQSGLIVVAQPDPANGSDFLGVEPDRCRFTRIQTAPFAVVTGETRTLADLALPRSTTQDRPSCLPSSASPTASPTATPTATPSPTATASP